MRLPSHVLTKLYLTGAMGTVGAIALLHPFEKPACKPCTGEVEPTAVEVDTSSLSDAFRIPHVPTRVVIEPPPQPLRPSTAIPVQIKAKPKTPHRAFASSCGHLVPIDPDKPAPLMPACGKG
jgi:hypothetical protein